MFIRQDLIYYSKEALGLSHLTASFVGGVTLLLAETLHSGIRNVGFRYVFGDSKRLD